MRSNVPDYLTILTLGADLVLMSGIWLVFVLARGRLSLGDRRARAMAIIAPLILTGWLAIAFWLSRAGIFEARVGGPIPPAIAYGVMLPVLVFGPVAIYSSAFGRILDQLSQSMIVGFQFYRTLGVLFLFAHAEALIPAVFAFPAGIGDILTGLLAIVVAVLFVNRRPGAVRYVKAWNVFGIADLVVAVTLGVLSSPGYFQMLSHDAPNQMISAYPLVMVPVFAVPLSFLLHLCSLRRLNRDRRNDAGSADPET